MNRIILSFLCALIFTQLNAQHNNLPLSHDANLIYDQKINTTEIHTSFRPLIKSTVNKKVNTDSLLISIFPNKWTNWYKRKLFSEYLIIIKGEKYTGNFVSP